MQRDHEQPQSRTRKDSKASILTDTDSNSSEQTVEERLLAALLAANAELVEALNQYDDMKRIAQERKVEKRSRQETRMDRHVSALSFDIRRKLTNAETTSNGFGSVYTTIAIERRISLADSFAHAPGKTRTRFLSSYFYDFAW